MPAKEVIARASDSSQRNWIFVTIVIGRRFRLDEFSIAEAMLLVVREISIKGVTIDCLLEAMRYNIVNIRALVPFSIEIYIFCASCKIRNALAVCIHYVAISAGRPAIKFVTSPGKGILSEILRDTIDEALAAHFARSTIRIKDNMVGVFLVVCRNSKSTRNNRFASYNIAVRISPIHKGMASLARLFWKECRHRSTILDVVMSYGLLAIIRINSDCKLLLCVVRR